ncbi:hypothetical protein L2E82_02824 [Cichorium intybus]|uniref:Uncharacterized protein n=1 Tax=Cichorium intybus TaxID=13427 RepID=A0ACB9H2F1_CICIN|nr:hypothetical protein L2E82_02824 [Cichorium intybus]
MALSSPSASQPTLRGFIQENWKHFIEKGDDPEASQRTDAILVAASVIAAMNFQAVISPPRGVYQDTGYKHNMSKEHEAGEAIGAYLDPDAYKNFYLANTISFTSSMSAMFLLLCGVSLKRRIFSMLTTATMFAAITATAYSYAVALESITPDWDPYLKKGWIYVQKIITMALVGWLVVGTLILVYFIETHFRESPGRKWLVRKLRALCGLNHA